MKKVFAILMLLAMLLPLLTGCQKVDLSMSDAPLTEEAKALIKETIETEDELTVDWDAEDWYAPYYGTIGGFAIVQASRGYLANNTGYIGVAGYGFKAEGYCFQLYAYRDGKVYTLHEAYRGEWLTKEQIGVIYERHQQIHAEWLKIQEKLATEPTGPVLQNLPLTVENIKVHVTEGMSWMKMEEVFEPGIVYSYGDPLNRPICIWRYVDRAVDGITLVVQFERPGFDTFIQWLEEIDVPTETTPDGNRYFVGASRYRQEWFHGMVATYGALYQDGELMEVLFGELET